MRRFLRFGAWLIVLLAAVLAGGFIYLRQSLPKTEGEVRLAGLAGAVDILRDRYGIPHIFAGSLADACFGLGYVHAQDRLWQMEMSRRIAAGRVSEVVGAGGLETDRFLRTLGVRGAAEAHRRAARTLDAGGFGGLGEDDGLGPGRQLAQRVAAHAPREDAAARAHPRAAAAVSRRAGACDRGPEGAFRPAEARA